MTSVVTDTAEAVELCPAYSLYLKPIAKVTVTVALPHLKMPGKSISNWEVMERLKAMVQPDQFSSLRISKSTMDCIRFQGEVENRSVVKRILARLEAKSIKLSGFTDVLKVRAAENRADFPTRHDWDSFFRDAKDMNETVPGERPDTVHLEGLPCRWFSQREGSPDRPSEDALKAVFQRFGKIRNVDIPMLDLYREEKNFNTFSFGGQLNFEGYVQYQDHTGFVKAMDSLRGMKLMFKGEDGKAVACNIKVTFDTSKHLCEASLKRRQQEREKLQELERQREEHKRREKEEEEKRKEEEKNQRAREEEEKERKREEKLRRREQKLKEREEKKSQKKMKKLQEEEQKKLHLKIATEERKLLLAQRNLESIRLIAELLSRAKALRQQQAEQKKAELMRLQQLQERRRLQEEELRRVESEKSRALELQRKERELRDRLLENLLKKSTNTQNPDCVLADLQPPDAQVNADVQPAALENLHGKPKKQEKKKKAEERGRAQDRRSGKRVGSGGRERRSSGRLRSRRRSRSRSRRKSRSRSRRKSRSRSRSLGTSRSRRKSRRRERGSSDRRRKYSHGPSSSSRSRSRSSRSRSSRSRSRSSSRGRCRR